MANKTEKEEEGGWVGNYLKLMNNYFYNTSNFEYQNIN